MLLFCIMNKQNNTSETNNVTQVSEMEKVFQKYSTFQFVIYYI